MLDRVQGLGGLDPESERVVAERGLRIRLAAGQRAFSSGADCPAYIRVTAGCVRVRLTTESGREIVLYRVMAGESCVLTTSHLFAHETYAADGVCETDVEALVLPVGVFRDLLGRSAAFRDLVLSEYARRVGDILMMVDTAASQAVPMRLARLLQERTRDGRLAATHQDLAVDLGTAREVVSRILKLWERRGIVSLGRGSVAVVDDGRLAALAGV